MEVKSVTNLDDLKLITGFPSSYYLYPTISKEIKDIILYSTLGPMPNLMTSWINNKNGEDRISTPILFIINLYYILL